MTGSMFELRPYGDPDTDRRWMMTGVEQYEVFCNGVNVGFIQVSRGTLSAEYCGKIVYQYRINDYSNDLNGDVRSPLLTACCREIGAEMFRSTSRFNKIVELYRIAPESEKSACPPK